MIILKNHSISKRGNARIITIKKESVKKVSKYKGEDILVFIENEKPINSRISASYPNYYIIINSEKTDKLKKYFGKPLNITIKLSKEVKK